MKPFIVEDGSGTQFEIEAASASEAARTHAVEAVHVDYLFTDERGVQFFALFDEEGNNDEDLMVWEA